MCVFRLHWESFLAQFSALKLPLNATVEMGGVNQVTHRVQSLVCRDVTLFFFLFCLLVETAAKLRPSLALKFLESIPVLEKKVLLTQIYSISSLLLS